MTINVLARPVVKEKTEVLEKRTRSAKHFLNPDGSYTAEITLGSVHYHDGKTWQDIDTNIQVDKSELGYRYANKKNNLVTKFNRTSAQPIKVEANGKSIVFRYQDVNIAQAVIDGNKITYPEAFTSTDMQYSVHPDRMKLLLNLKDSNAPKTFKTQMQMSGVTYRLNDNGTIDFLDENDNVVFKTPRMWAKDSSSDELRYDVMSVSVSQEGSNFFLEYALDDTNLTYPIEVDPTVTIQGGEASTKDLYVDSDNSDTITDTDPYFYTGYYATQTFTWRAFVEWDLSSIPTNSYISKATATLTLYNSVNTTSNRIEACRITSSWTEGSMNWAGQPGFTKTDAAFQDIGTTVDTAHNWDVSVIMRDCFKGNSYYGLAFVARDETKDSAKGFHSSSATTSGYRPKIYVDYNEAPTAPTITSPNGGETWTGSQTITWNASTDAETVQTSLEYQVDLSGDNGLTWKSLLPRRYDGPFTLVQESNLGKAYDTSGNGGRHITQISDGTYIAVFATVSNTFEWYKSKDGVEWTSFAWDGMNANTNISIESKGNMVYTVVGNSGGGPFFYAFDATTASGEQTFTNLDGTTSSYGNNSIIINEAGTELHVVWAQKTSGYPNSFNLVYATAPINADGTVGTWTKKLLTQENSTSNSLTQPSILLDEAGKPHILFIFQTGTTYYVMDITNAHTNNANLFPKDAGWGTESIFYETNGYTQSKPSALFVPSTVNGLVNGRMHVAWLGKESVNNNEVIMYSYADGSSGWVTKQDLNAAGGYKEPSITADKNNNIYVLYPRNTNGYFSIYQLKHDGVGWTDSRITADNTSNNDYHPSTFFDRSFTVDMTGPTFIWQDNEIVRIGFYGNVNLTTAGATSHVYDFSGEAETTSALIRTRAHDGTHFGNYDQSDAVFTISHNAAPGAPTSTSPADNIRTGTLPVFEATIPDDAENHNQHFVIQLAEDSAFTLGLLERNTETAQTGWQAKTSTGSYVAMPTTGVDSTYEGGTVQHTWQTALTEGKTYYWRIASIDSKGKRGSWSLTRTIRVGNQLQFTLGSVSSQSERPKRILLTNRSIMPTDGAVPASIKIEACNNGLDTTPTWEDITTAVNNRDYHMFTNDTKTAASWGVNVRVTINANDSKNAIELAGFGFAFE